MPHTKRGLIVLLTAVAITLQTSNHLHGQLLLEDTFDDGIPDPRFSTFGAATMVESGGSLSVEMFENSGIDIDVSDLDDIGCFSLEFDIDPAEFLIGDSLQLSVFATSGSTGALFTPLEILISRPFWNRAQYRITQKDGNQVVVGFWKNRPEQEFPAPDASKLRFDWLGDVDGDGIDDIWIEIEGRELDTRMIRPGNRLFNSVDRFNHENDKIEFVKIEKIDPPLGCDPTVQCGDYVLNIDALTISADHEGAGVPAVALTPDLFDRGQVATVEVVTDEPFLVPDVSILDMGPNVLVRDFTVISSTEAVAEIEVLEHSSSGGEGVLVQTGENALMGAFDINPVGVPDDIANHQPFLEVVAPDVVQQNVPFTVGAIFDDMDDVSIYGEIVIMETITTAEVFTSGSLAIDTSSDAPSSIEFLVDGLAAGDYEVISIANDGIAGTIVARTELSVVPEPSGLLLSLAGIIGVLVYHRRFANT